MKYCKLLKFKLTLILFILPHYINYHSNLDETPLFNLILITIKLLKKNIYNFDKNYFHYV